MPAELGGCCRPAPMVVRSGVPPARFHEEEGEVVATFRQPFDLLAETTAIAARHGAGNTAKSAKSKIWLPFLDTYRTMCLAPQDNFRRVLEEVREMRLAA